MRHALLLFLLFAGCAPEAPSPVTPTRRPDLLSALRSAIAERTASWKNPWDGSLQRVELSPIGGDLYVALFDWEARWWGDFVVFRAVGGKLEWTAALSEQEGPGGAYVFSARGFRLPGFDAPLVEVYGSTHMGNGALYLYELRDRRLHLLLDAWAVDRNTHEGEVYRGGRLYSSYEDVDGDGIADVTL